ncbi:MAG: hypothetical protein WC307_06080 [Candidatus Nanoarchaeia archaeon]
MSTNKISSIDLTNWFMDKVSSIVVESRCGDEPLDGDEVDSLTEHFRNFANFHEGNLTREEFDKLEGFDNL